MPRNVNTPPRDRLVITLPCWMVDLIEHAAQEQSRDKGRQVEYWLRQAIPDEDIPEDEFMGYPTPIKAKAPPAQPPAAPSKDDPVVQPSRNNFFDR